MPLDKTIEGLPVDASTFLRMYVHGVDDSSLHLEHSDLSCLLNRYCRSNHNHKYLFKIIEIIDVNRVRVEQMNQGDNYKVIIPVTDLTLLIDVKLLN